MMVSVGRTSNRLDRQLTSPMQFDSWTLDQKRCRIGLCRIGLLEFYREADLEGNPHSRLDSDYRNTSTHEARVYKTTVNNNFWKRPIPLYLGIDICISSSQVKTFIMLPPSNRIRPFGIIPLLIPIIVPTSPDL